LKSSKNYCIVHVEYQENCNEIEKIAKIAKSYDKNRLDYNSYSHETNFKLTLLQQIQTVCKKLQMQQHPRALVKY